MKLSVIIVNYNVKHFLEQCLYSVRKAAKNLAIEVWVVDNNSVDGSVEMLKEKFPEVKLIENKKNAGFSVANNQAIKESNGEYVLLLNPDTIVEEETFTKTLAFMDAHPDAGALGVKMMDGKGNFLPESKRALPTPEVAFYKIFGLSSLFPASKKFGKYHLTYLSKDEINKVDVLAGAFMLIRKAALDKTGLLDETFFMYGEDIDLSYRLTKSGYSNYYFPQTRIIHYKGESTKKSSVNYVIVFYNAMRIFAQKHFTGKNAKLFSFLVNMAIFFRASIAILHRFFSRMILPLIDFITIYAGYYCLSLFYADIKFSSGNYFSRVFLLLILPCYILIWLFSILFSGGYDKPIKQWKIIRGILWGTGLILVMYALLPDAFRFSRALILIGTAWVILALITIRALLMVFKVKGFTPYRRRLLIIGDEDENKRVHGLLEKTGIGMEEVRFINPVAHTHTHTSVWSETVKIYHINEVIFCAKSLSSQIIMDAMSTITGPGLEFKIAPPESWAIIGSNSIHTSGELYMIDLQAINLTPNVRNKRLFDVVLSLLLFVFSPVICLTQKRPLGFFSNLFWVIIGEKSWVGYAPVAHTRTHTVFLLPSIKKGILSPLDALPAPFDNATIHDVNSIYARDYNVVTDIRIVRKGFRNLGRISFLLLAMLVSTYVAAQTSKTYFSHPDTSFLSKADSIARQKDMADIFNTLLKRHVKTGPDSSLERPGKLFFSLAPAAGYTLEGGPIAVVTVNASFYASNPGSTNLSVFTLGGEYSLHNQLLVPIISDIWSKDNKFDWLGDWRYYSYPTNTYGLGSDNHLSVADATYYKYIKIYQEVLRHFSSNYYAGIGYNFDDHFNISSTGDATDFLQYSNEINNALTRTISSGPILHLMYDSRTNINNPKDALLASVIYRTNFTFLGSTENWRYLQIEIRKYFRLSSHDVLAFWSWNEFTWGAAPYFDLPADQWDTYGNTGRGYIQGFYRGTNLVYLEAEYRFGITRNGLFGGVIFSNAGSATQWPNNKFEYIDPGEGVGLRIKFNKYSDVNLCIDYAVGLNGSHGLFFNLGEVF